MSDLQQLIEFGFDEKRARRALRKTRNAGLQPALDYLQDHEDSTGETSGDEGDADGAAGASASVPEIQGEAKSLRCVECGKQFRSTAEASYHGEKSGHSNFEESTEEKRPLTEQEKKEKLAELREKAAARKAAAAKSDAEEAKKNDAIRRKADKDLGAIKEEMKLKEALKAAEQKKKEKLDDARARAKIKAQIEADKKERADKAAKEKALRDGTALPAESSSTAPSGPKPPASNAPSASPAAAKKETRLQIRLPTGNPIVTTRQSEDTLQSVLDWIKEQPAAAGIEGKISIPFPRKVFSSEEMRKTLVELGLTPSSVLIVN